MKHFKVGLTKIESTDLYIAVPDDWTAATVRKLLPLEQAIDETVDPLDWWTAEEQCYEIESIKPCTEAEARQYEVFEMHEITTRPRRSGLHSRGATMTEMQRELLAVVFGQPAVQPQQTPQADGHPLIGENVFIRTVTYHYTGRLVSYEYGYLKLADAAWVADSGRWAKALATGVLEEVEPYPSSIQVYVRSDGIADVSQWLHALPREQKP